MGQSGAGSVINGSTRSSVEVDILKILEQRILEMVIVVIGVSRKFGSQEQVKFGKAYVLTNLVVGHSIF